MPGEIPPPPVTQTPQTVSASTSLKEVSNWDGKSQAIYQVVAAAFEAKDYADCIRNLQARGIEPGLYINSLDQVRT